MGLNFRKSIKIAKGVSVNVGTGGVSVSLRGKKKGIGYSLNSSGRATVSLPGTGLSLPGGIPVKPPRRRISGQAFFPWNSKPSPPCRVHIRRRGSRGFRGLFHNEG